MPKRTPGYGVWASGYAATAGGRGGRKARSGGAVRLDTASGGTAPDGPDAARHRGLSGYLIRTARCHCDAQAASAWPQRIKPRAADRADAPEPAHERRLTPMTAAPAARLVGKLSHRGKRSRPRSAVPQGVIRLYSPDRPAVLRRARGGKRRRSWRVKGAAVIRRSAPKQQETPKAVSGRRAAERNRKAGPERRAYGRTAAQRRTRSGPALWPGYAPAGPGEARG